MVLTAPSWPLACGCGACLTMASGLIHILSSPPRSSFQTMIDDPSSLSLCHCAISVVCGWSPEAIHSPYLIHRRQIPSYERHVFMTASYDKWHTNSSIFSLVGGEGTSSDRMAYELRTHRRAIFRPRRATRKTKY